jgi:hypothetical protein
MCIEKKITAAGLLGLVALVCMGSTAQAQMMRGRMGGMMMGGGMMGGMRGPFMTQVSPMMGTFGGMGAINPSMALFQPRTFGSNLNLGTGMTNFGFSGFGNTFAMPNRGIGMGGYGMGGYGMGGYGMGGGYGAAGSGYGMGNHSGAASYDYGSRTQQIELPHPAGDVRVPPADAAVIRLRVPDQFAAISFNGQSVSSIGTRRTYVTPINDVEGGAVCPRQRNRQGQPPEEPASLARVRRWD